jgi:hypothetical protein
MRLELPLIWSKKGEGIKINQNNFIYMEFTLWDFMME